MSVHVYFAFSAGLAKPIAVPPGTLAKCQRHVEEVEDKLRLVATRYRDNPAHWESRNRFDGIDDKVVCETVIEHNRWVRWFYDDLERWAKDPPEVHEVLTPDDAQTFWHGLEMLRVPPERWDRHYYRDQMERFYEAMRGRGDGIYWPTAKLTPKQAGAVIWLFSDILDCGDIRLEVPRGADRLASSYDGEYEWCERCGAVENDDAANCRKRGCPVQANWCDEDRPEWFRPAKASRA